MHSGQAIKKILYAAKKWQQRKTIKAEIDRRLRNLKNKGLLWEYPLEKVQPSVSNYKFFKKSDVKWLDFYYSVYGKPDKNFIPVSVYYHIEDCLNDRMLTYALKEKNFYDNFLGEIKTPLTLLRRINGFFYDERFNRMDVDDALINSWRESHKSLFIKPSVVSGGGGSIIKFELNNDSYLYDGSVLNPDFLSKYKFDFILQENIKQHSFFSQFNPDSNNTLRFFIYRSVQSDQIHILHTLLRIGAKGFYVDHDHTGGVAVSLIGNYLQKYALDINGIKYEHINGIALSEVGKVPFIEEAANIARSVASRVYYGRLLALDFSIDEHGQPLFIEMNCRRNGTSQYQMNNGGLFKEFTNEILDFCAKTEPGYVLEL